MKIKPKGDGHLKTKMIRAHKMISGNQKRSRKKDDIFSFTNFPSGTVIIHVYISYWVGRSVDSVVPVNGITLSSPWSLQGPNDAKTEKQRKKQM